MTRDLKSRLRENYQEARRRETRFLMSFDMPKLNGRLLLLFMVFVTLNGLDVLTTLVAIGSGPPFVELNPIASKLFGLNIFGFIGALALKYMPLVPLGYVTFLRENAVRPVAFRVVKVSAFVALSAGVVIYLFVVGSNVLTLLHYFLV